MQLYDQTSVKFCLKEIDCNRERYGITYLLHNIHQASYGNTLAPLLAFTDLKTFTGQYAPHPPVDAPIYPWFVQNPVTFSVHRHYEISLKSTESEKTTAVLRFPAVK